MNTLLNSDEALTVISENYSLSDFDFDHCAYGWRAYDIAIACWYPAPQRDSMMQGYESQRP